jgi:hypothetical protein
LQSKMVKYSCNMSKKLKMTYLPLIWSRNCTNFHINIKRTNMHALSLQILGLAHTDISKCLLY